MFVITFSSTSCGTVTHPICESIAATSNCHKLGSRNSLTIWRTYRLMREERLKASGLTIAKTSTRTLMLFLKVFSSSSFSAVTSRYCSIDEAIAFARRWAGQGLVRNLKIFPSFTALMAESRSALPVSMTRTVFGHIERILPRNSIPSIPGMRKSETTTANGPRSEMIFSPSAALCAVSILNCLRNCRR